MKYRIVQREDGSFQIHKKTFLFWHKYGGGGYSNYDIVKGIVLNIIDHERRIRFDKQKTKCKKTIEEFEV